MSPFLLSVRVTAFPGGVLQQSWDRGVFEHSPFHGDLAALLSPQRWSDWPGLVELNALLVHGAKTASGHRLHFVMQGHGKSQPATAYEMHIDRQGAIGTRPGNWHDLFNALIWALFPATKSALNAVHIGELASAGGQRSPRRDAVTLLDECGVILPVADEKLTRMHTSHRWHGLFCTERGAWGRRIAAMIVGHGLYEQCLHPYIGLTAKALHWPVPAAWFGQPLAVRYRQLDAMLAAAIAQGEALVSSQELLPLPILGVPGYWPANREPGFYDNQAYFRPRSTR